MSTDEVGWAPANRWFAKGYDQALDYQLSGLTIKLLPLGYYLASKLDAYQDRGEDPRTSHDFEDLVYLINHTSTFVKEILRAKGELREYLIQSLTEVRSSKLLQEGIRAHLFYEFEEQHLKRILQRIEDAIAY